MLAGQVLVAAGCIALATDDRSWGWALIAPGVLLFLGVVVYRMVTATADD